MCCQSWTLPVEEKHQKKILVIDDLAVMQMPQSKKAAETQKLILSQCQMPLENSAFLLDESLQLCEFHQISSVFILSSEVCLLFLFFCCFFFSDINIGYNEVCNLLARSIGPIIIKTFRAQTATFDSFYLSLEFLFSRDVKNYLLKDN